MSKQVTYGPIYLTHKRTNDRINCRTFTEALREFYRQYRDIDGSIPWIIVDGPNEYTETDLYAA